MEYLLLDHQRMLRWEHQHSQMSKGRIGLLHWYMLPLSSLLFLWSLLSIVLVVLATQLSTYHSLWNNLLLFLGIFLICLFSYLDYYNIVCTFSFDIGVGTHEQQCHVSLFGCLNGFREKCLIRTKHVIATRRIQNILIGGRNNLRHRLKRSYDVWRDWRIISEQIVWIVGVRTNHSNAEFSGRKRKRKNVVAILEKNNILLRCFSCQLSWRDRGNYSFC